MGIKVSRKYDETDGRTIEATGKCEVCRRELDFLNGRDNLGDVYCDCGAIYNASGQRLKDPDQWEEQMESD